MDRLFEERERAAEARFAHEAEALFRARCAAIRTFGLHEAGRMGLEAPAAATYAADLVAASVGGIKDAAILERVRADLAANGIDESAEALAARWEQARARALTAP